MGRFLITTYLTWYEPEAIVRSRRLAARGRLTFRQANLWAAVIGTVFVIGQLINRRAPGDFPLVPFPASIPAGIAIGYGCVYLMVWISGRGASQVRITDRGIDRNAATYKQWKYDRIARCEIATRDYEGESVTMLLAHSKDGRTATFGIDPELSLDELTRVLADCGVVLERSNISDRIANVEAATGPPAGHERR